MVIHGTDMRYRYDRWTKDESGRLQREVISAKLLEVSVVTWPAYDSTSIKAESPAREGTIKADRFVENSLLELETEESIF